MDSKTQPPSVPEAPSGGEEERLAEFHAVSVSKRSYQCPACGEETCWPIGKEDFLAGLAKGRELERASLKTWGQKLTAAEKERDALRAQVEKSEKARICMAQALSNANYREIKDKEEIIRLREVCKTEHQEKNKFFDQSCRNKQDADAAREELKAAKEEAARLRRACETHGVAEHAKKEAESAYKLLQAGMEIDRLRRALGQINEPINGVSSDMPTWMAYWIANLYKIRDIARAALSPVAAEEGGENG